MIGGIDSPIYTNFARHLYRVRIKGTSLQNVYPTIELAYAAGFLGKEKPYNDVWIKIAVEGYDEKFLFKINTSDKDWFKDLNERVASRLGKPHVTVVFQGEALNEYTLYKIVHSNHSNVYSVEYRQANIPVFKPTSASSSSSTVLQRLSISQTDFASIIQGFLENALTDLSKQVSSEQSFSIEEWIEGFSAMSKEEVFDFIFNYYKTYQLQINGTPYRLMDIIAQQQPPVNVSHVANTFVGISRAFTSIILDNLNAKRSLQHDKKAAASLLRSSIKMFAAQYTARLVDALALSSSSSTGQREPLDDDDDDDNDREERDKGEREDEDVAQPIATELRFIGVKFNVPLPSLSGTANRLRNAKNSLVNATSKSKYVEFSLSPAASVEAGRGVKGRVLQLLQNVVSEVEPGDMLRYRILPGDEPKWVRVDIEENAADYRGNFSKDGWTIVTSNKIRRPSSVAFDAPYMTFPLVWARYRVRVYVERKDAVDRWKLEGERNFNCSVKGGKKGNEFTWAQLREVVANEELSAKLKVTKEIQSMRVSNRPPFVFRDIQGGPTISHFPKDAYKCLETAWQFDEEQQQDDSLALVFWSELKSYAQKKSQRILVARKLIWARFNNARLDASRYETESLYNPAYEDEYIHAPVVAKGECPYDDDEHQEAAEESISAWYNPLPPLTDANMGFGTAGSNTRTMVVDKRYQELNLPMAEKAELASESPAAQERQRRDLEFLVTKVVRPPVIVPTFSRSSSSGRMSPSILTSSPPPSPIKNESEDEVDDLVLAPPPAAPLQTLKESYLKNRRLSTNDIRVKKYEESITTEDEYREIADSTEANVIVTVSIPVFLFTSAINLYTFKQVGSYSVEQRFIAGELKTEPGSEIPNLYGALFNDLTGQLNPYKVYFLVYDTRPGQIQSRWVNATQELYQSISSKDSEVSAMILCEQTVFRENFNARRRLASILNVYGGQVKLDPNARFSPVSFVKFWVGRTPYPSANDSLASMTDAYVNLANLAVFTGLNTEKRIDDDGGIHLEIAYTTTIVHVDANGNTFITNVPVDSNSKDASLFDAFVIDENNYSIWFNHSTISIDLSKVGDAGSPTTTNAIIDKGLGVFIVTLKNVQPPKDIAEKLRFYNYAARTLRDVVSKRYHDNPSNGWNVSPVEHKRLHTLLGAFIVVKPQDSGKGKGKAAASSGEEDELIPVTGRDQSSTEKLYALKKTFFVNRPLGYNDIVVWSGRKYITNDEELANAKEKLRTFVNIPVFRIESTETAYTFTQRETLIFESGSLTADLVNSSTQGSIGRYDFATFTTSLSGQSIRALAYSNQGRVTMSLLDSDTFNSISEKNSDVFGIIISPPNRHEPKDYMFNDLIEKALTIYAKRVVTNPRQKVQPPNLKYVIFVVAGVQYLSAIATSDEMLIAYMTFSNSKAFVNVEAELIPTSDPILLNVNYIARRIWIKSTGEVAVTNVNVLSFNYEQSLADLLLLESTQSVWIPYIDTNNEIAFANNVKTTGDVFTRGFGVFVVTENDATLSQEIQEKLKIYLAFIDRTQDAIKDRIANGPRKWMSAPNEQNTENQLIEDFTTKDAKSPAASSSSPSASSSADTGSQTPPQSGVRGLIQRARALLPGFSSSPPTPPTPVSIQPSSSSGAASSSSTSDTGRRSSKSSSSSGAASSSPPEQYYTYLPSSFTVGKGNTRIVTIPEFALDDTKNYGVKYTRDVKVGNTQIAAPGTSYVYTKTSQPLFNKFFNAKDNVHAVTIEEDGVAFNKLTPDLKSKGLPVIWRTKNIVALLVSNNENLNLTEDMWVPPSLDAFKHAFMELKGATDEGRQAVFNMMKDRQFFANAFKTKEDAAYLVLEGQDPIDELITDLNEDIVPLLPRSLIRIVDSGAIATTNQKPVDHEIPFVFNITVNVRVYFTEDTIRRSTVELRSNGLVTGGDVDLLDVDLSAFASTILGDAKFNDYNVVFMRTDDSPVTSVGDAVMKGTYAIVIHPQDGDYATAVDDLRVAYTQQLEIVLRDDDEEQLAVYKRVFEDDIAVYDKNKIIGAEIIGDEHLPGCLEEWIGHYAKRGDILEEDGAHLILLPSDTRQLNEDIVAGRIDAEDHIEKYTHRFPFGDSFAKHARKLPPIEVNGQKLIVRRNFNKEAGRLELAIETENGHIHSVPVTTYVDEASRLVVSVPSSAFFKF